MGDEERKSKASFYKGKKKREYRRRKRSRTADSGSSQDVKEISSSASNEFNQTLEQTPGEYARQDQPECFECSEGDIRDDGELKQEESGHVLGDQPLPEAYENFGNQSSISSDINIAAELDKASTSLVKSRSSFGREAYYSASTHESSSCKDESCKQTQRRLGNKIEKLKQEVKICEREKKQYEERTSNYQLQFYYAKGLESSDLLEKVDKAFNFRGYSLLSLATLDNRLQANTSLLQQGISLISDSELEIKDLISKGPNSNVYEAIFKGTKCAVKVYKGATFSSVCKEYHILMILSSHVSVPHAYGVVKGIAPKLVLSAYQNTHVTLPSFKFRSGQMLGRFTVSLLEVVLHLHSRNVLHNNISPSNVLVEQDSGKVTLCGFSNASYGMDGYYANGVGMRDRFGDVCSLPPEVKLGKKPLSFASEVFCMGFTLMWHAKIYGKAKVSEVSNYVRRLTHDCINRSEQERPREEHLNTSVVHINRLLED